MKKLFIILVVFLFAVNYANAQGCVAVRSTGAFCTKQDAMTANAKGWQLNLGYRYFRSFRHYRGDEPQAERLEENTEVINWSHNLDVTLVRNFNSRWSMALNVPVISNVRSSLYEHGGNAAGKDGRHKTRSFGIGDVRLSAYYWLLDPAKSMNVNIQVGAGLKLATGDYRYQDYFVKADGSKVLGPVDQSIQLGDGGTGFTTEVNAFLNFTHNIGVYGNFYYLFNPREQNGVSTARGGTPSATAIQYGSDVMSVPDQYMARGGVNLTANKGFSFSAGLRYECVPSEDAIGGSNGFRRPGYILSFEPAITYQLKKATIFASVPVALERNRIQSMPDKIRTEQTGIYAKGDAAFADYLVNIGCSFKL
jgi:hypothetical protein